MANIKQAQREYEKAISASIEGRDNDACLHGLAALRIAKNSSARGAGNLLVRAFAVVHRARVDNPANIEIGRHAAHASALIH